MSATVESISEQLYEWSLREAGQEVEREFSLASLVKGQNADKYVRFFQKLPAVDVYPASQALVKRMNQPVLLRQQTVLTEAEKNYVQAYLKYEEISGPDGSRVIQADRSGVVWTVQLRKTLKSLVKERFRMELGKLEGLSANEWIHESNVGSVRIRTYLNFGGRSSMSYSHMILQKNRKPFRAHLSLLQWLGAASMTRWRVLRAEELLDSADAVTTLCRHFIGEMATLFAE